MHGKNDHAYEWFYGHEVARGRVGVAEEHVQVKRGDGRKMTLPRVCARKIF